MAKSDVIYCTRIQRERFSTDSEYARNTLRVDAATLKKAKKEAIVMHPLPRNEELAEDVDTDTRAVYFKQMENGMYTRMALLAMIMYRDGGLP